MGQSRSREWQASAQDHQQAARAGGTPQIRCYTCSGIFMTTQRVDHIRCPFCSTINGVPNASPQRALQRAGGSGLGAAASSSGGGQLTTAASQRQEQLLRRLQAREITPLELLILREFVEHLQQTRTGASTPEIDVHTASWTVEDVTKLPEELRSCCVCLEDVCAGHAVRTLPCLHTFHAECAEQWLQKKKVCPLCQFPIDGNTNEPTADASATPATTSATMNT